MKKIIILGLGVAAFFMQGCDFLDRTPEDIIETGKFFESANANALEQYCNDFYPKLINGHGAPKGVQFDVGRRLELGQYSSLGKE